MTLRAAIAAVDNAAVSIEFSRAVTRPRLGIDPIEIPVPTRRSSLGRASSLLCSTSLPEHDEPMEIATGSAEHWDHVYGHGDATRSWFQLQAVWSLQMLDRVGIDPSDSVIDVGGGSSPFTAALLARGHSDLTVPPNGCRGSSGTYERGDHRGATWCGMTERSSIS
jgi:hypothetical protein